MEQKYSNLLLGLGRKLNPFFFLSFMVKNTSGNTDTTGDIKHYRRNAEEYGREKDCVERL